jgi:hypothetical protein
VLCNIVIEFGIPMKLVRLINKQTYNNVHTDKNLCHVFHTQNGLNKEMLYCHFFQLWFKICHQEGPGKLGRIEIH